MGVSDAVRRTFNHAADRLVGYLRLPEADACQRRHLAGTASSVPQATTRLPARGADVIGRQQSFEIALLGPAAYARVAGVSGRSNSIGSAMRYPRFTSLCITDSRRSGHATELALTGVREL